MDQGEEVKTRDNPPVQILESGEIFFFYRPKVDREEAHSVDDVQRLYIVLRPESGERAIEEKQASDSGKEGAKGASKAVTGRARLARRGAKRVAAVAQARPVRREAKVAMVVRVFLMFSLCIHRKLSSTLPEKLEHFSHYKEFDTATRGHRRKPPARALGKGVYRILRHYKSKKMDTHLIYKLELRPEDKKDEPQESLNIEREGSFIIQIKNPEQETFKRFPGLQKSKRRAVFPAHLQGVFGQRGYAPADPPDLLNYEGCEFLLIAASDDIDEELGLDIQTEGESNRSCSDLIETFGEVAPTKPLLEGTWA
ncbi:hypothetical protein CKAN_01302400 [Cinnamomum micranthum f. kanehirae]|uniref:Uncharacterized protein n=1 Tax=Cinnamomum micranthum f. kanehirae TaxID=337451 RepID=A0A3S3N2H2_9MAGN|nr:hypothetical protein CKAN_01302400 [Cinnamomum micranthum f. kanehirae]